MEEEYGFDLGTRNHNGRVCECLDGLDVWMLECFIKASFKASSTEC